jgi:hypothetical protein
LLCSCEEKKTEFIQSKAIPDVFLLKNLPREDSLIKEIIKKFLLKNPPKKDIYFFEYNWKTKYFINNKEDYSGGLSGEELGFYPDAQIGVFIISKCKNDTTKLVGKLRFYNKYGNYYKPDTIIYKCK